MKVKEEELTPELIQKRLKDLRKIIGTGTVRSLILRKSVFKVWRRTTPHNWWVENEKGEFLWHSSEGCPRPSLSLFFELIEDSDKRIWTGRPDIIGSDEGAPELSIYKLKELYIN